MNKTELYKKIRKPLQGLGLKKISIIQSLDKKIKNNLWRDEIVTSEGIKMKLYKGSGDSIELSTFGVYEKYETELIKQHIKHGMTVMDVGASIGYYTLLMSKLVGPTGKVYAFESDYSKLLVLKENLWLNHCSNVILERRKVSDHTDKNNVRLDDKLSKVDLIKMDIEGMEDLALTGMEKLECDILITEFHPSELRRFETDPHKFLAHIQDLGFEIYNIDEKNQIVEPLDKVLEYTNLFCFKGNLKTLLPNSTS